jgi:hypothetical protein
LRRAEIIVLSAAFFVYFVVYPADLAALLAPMERLLAVSNAASLGLYGVIAVALLAWAMVRIWGTKSANSTVATTPPT